MRIGDFSVDPLIDGEAVSTFEYMYSNLEPGCWEKHQHFLDPADGSAVITLGGYLVRDGKRVIVVDAGIGSNPVSPMTGGGFRSALLSHGVRPDEVTDVIFTHLHFDHIGWASVGGRAYFPNATYRVDQREWDHFTGEDYVAPGWEHTMTRFETDSARARLLPIADRFECFVGEVEVLPGVTTMEAAGHTPGSTVFVLSSRGEQGALLGDLVHTQPELLEDDWDFNKHTDHEASIEAIRRVRSWLLARDVPFAAAHFPGLRWGRLTSSKGRLGYTELP